MTFIYPAHVFVISDSKGRQKCFETWNNNIADDEEVIKTFEELLQEKELLTKEFFVVPVEKVIVEEPEKDPDGEIGDKKDDDDSVSSTGENVAPQSVNVQENDIEPKDGDNKSNDVEVNTGRTNAWQALDKKLVGLYFSAGWCPPCRQFTPLLKEFYEETQRRGAPFEVVFVSCDKKEEDMISYYRESHGEWLVVPFEDELADDLRTRFSITAVPKLLIVNNSGDVITLKGRKEIQDKGIVCFRTWQEIATFREKRARSQASMAPPGDPKEEEGADNPTQT